MRLLPITLAVLTLFFGATARSEQVPAEKADPPQNSRFIDLDGDGLDDNIRDLDRDGIPDFRKETNPEPPSETARGNPDFFKAIEASNSTSEVSLFLSNSERFEYLKFCTRALSQCRSGLSSSEEFGPGIGIGQSTSTGGCAGGICH